MNNDNELWIRKQINQFFDSKLSDVVLFEKAKMIRAAAKKRGMTDDDVSAMYTKIRKERASNE